MTEETNFIELTHPGRMLQEEMLEPLGMTAYRLSKGIGLSQTAVSAVLRGERNITPTIGLLIDKFFGFSPGYWYSLQADYDLEKTQRLIAARLAAIEPYPRPELGQAA